MSSASSRASRRLDKFGKSARWSRNRLPLLLHVALQVVVLLMAILRLSRHLANPKIQIPGMDRPLWRAVAALVIRLGIFLLELSCARVKVLGIQRKVPIMLLARAKEQQQPKNKSKRRQLAEQPHVRPQDEKLPKQKRAAIISKSWLLLPKPVPRVPVLAAKEGALLLESTSPPPSLKAPRLPRQIKRKMATNLLASRCVYARLRLVRSMDLLWKMGFSTR